MAGEQGGQRPKPQTGSGVGLDMTKHDRTKFKEGVEVARKQARTENKIWAKTEAFPTGYRMSTEGR